MIPDPEELKKLPKMWVCEKCEDEMSPRPEGQAEVLYGICDHCYKITQKK